MSDASPLHAVTTWCHGKFNLYMNQLLSGSTSGRVVVIYIVAIRNLNNRFRIWIRYDCHSWVIWLPTFFQWWSASAHLSLPATSTLSVYSSHLCTQQPLITCSQPSIYSQAPYSLLCLIFCHETLQRSPAWLLDANLVCPWFSRSVCLLVIIWAICPWARFLPLWFCLPARVWQNL